MIDWVRIKSEIQKIIIAVTFAVCVWNPIYTVLLLGIGAFLRHQTNRKRYYLIALSILAGCFALAAGIVGNIHILPVSIMDYLFGVNPIRICASIVVTIVCVFFDFGDVDRWMISEEKKKQNRIYEDTDSLDFSKRHHVFVAGTTGSGKSQFLEKMIKDSFDKGEPIYIISGKGSSDKHSLLDDVREMAEEYNRKLWVVSMNPESKDRKKYNPFKQWTAVEIADALCNASEFTEPHYREHLSCWVKIVCECLMLASVPICLDSIVSFMGEEQFEILINHLKEKKKIDAQKAKNYLTYLDIGKIASSSRARFINIMVGDGREIFGEKDGICAADAREENAVFFLDLDSFKYTDFTRVVGAFFINDMRHLVATEDNPNVCKRIFMDELSTFVTPQIMPLFSQSRSFGYQIVVATQSISDLDEISPVFAERILENCNQYAILRLNSATDAERISMVIGTVPAVETTRKSTGMQLHYTADGSKKVVNAFKITPDNIKELKSLEVLIYDKDKPDALKRIKLKYGWKN